MNRRIVMNGVLGGLFGLALAIVGFKFTTWQYWLLYAIFLAAIINSLIEPRHG